MKRVIISLILIIGIFIFALGSFLYITGSTSDIIGKVELVQKNFENGEYEKAILLSQEAESMWKRFSENRLLLVENEYSLKIGIIITRVSALAKDKNSDLKMECHSLLFLLQELYDKQIPGYKNVF